MKRYKAFDLSLIKFRQTKYFFAALMSLLLLPCQSYADIGVKDPGPSERHFQFPKLKCEADKLKNIAGAGEDAKIGLFLPDLSCEEIEVFEKGKATFQEIDFVTNPNTEGTGGGLGPRYNSISCAGCHIHPAVGGSSPAINPQIEAAKAGGARNDLPPGITRDGPIREARFKWLMDANDKLVSNPHNGSIVPDGGVHALFTISGRSDANGCNISQPPFTAAEKLKNLIFRIPTPLYGAGLIEAIDDETINANALTENEQVGKENQAKYKMFHELSISGKVGRGKQNKSGNDSTVTRYGWKAQNKSLLLFAGEAYNVEQGVTNELFTNERDEEKTPLPVACKANPTPEDKTDYSKGVNGTIDNSASDLTLFTAFMRMLAPPEPTCGTLFTPACAPNIVSGKKVFDEIHCSACHTPKLKLSTASYTAINTNGDSPRTYAELYSDLLLHDMGNGLSDDIQQGAASGSEFRTSPLWGVGSRLFFLHDGRARNLPDAIAAHSSVGSEANKVIKLYDELPDEKKQHLIDFLRSL